MTTLENPKDNPIHFPSDRGLHLWTHWSWLIALLVAALVLFALAWLQYLLFGLPQIAVPPQVGSLAPAQIGFPAWLRLAHYVNFLFIILLMRSGLSILMDHPRLYWNDHSTLGTEWIRFTPVTTPPYPVWTAKEDARYISPWLALPPYHRHSTALALFIRFVLVCKWFDLRDPALCHRRLAASRAPILGDHP